MKKYEQATKRTRKGLFDAFWQLYLTNDITKITVKGICEIANCDRTTFYRYFTNITDICNQLEDEIIDDMRDRINRNKGDEVVLTYDKFKVFSDMYGEYIVVFYEKGDRRFYTNFKKLIKEEVYDYLHFDIKNEEMKEFVYAFLFSSISSSYVCWYRNQHMMDLEAMVKLLNGMLLNGTNIILSYTK